MDFKDLETMFLLLGALKCLKDLKPKQKKNRSCAVRPINRTRVKFGYYKVTFIEMKNQDEAQFFVHTRMSPKIFDMLLNLVRSQMAESSRNLLSSEFRLALTLLYLSQGSSFQTIAWSWKVGKETARIIIYETCEALWQVLGQLYVPEPNLDDTSLIAEDFKAMWDFPNCVGAIDGKHIAIQCPPSSGSQFFNYKKYHSIVLMAACDAKYIFTYVDVGAYGSQSDGGIFNISSFGKRLCSGKLALPEPATLPNTTKVVPHFFVGDAAFTLTANLMKPYPGIGLPKPKEVFNKRLSRARRVIENAFGILVSRWRILLTTLYMRPENAEKVVLACVGLHNFLRQHTDLKHMYASSQYTDWEDANHSVHNGMWREEIYRNVPSIQPSRSLHVLGGSAAIKIRDTLCSYVNNEGSLDWLH